jgi:large subunit ribosomal protein L13
MPTKTSTTEPKKVAAPKKPMKPEEWFLVDATDKVLGRMATDIAMKLMEKDTPTFEPNHDSRRRHIVVINAAKLRLSPKKLEGKLYHRHSRYLGNLKTATMGEMMQKDARKVIELAVKGMLPKNRMQSVRMNRLHVYLDDKHKHPQVTENKA